MLTSRQGVVPKFWRATVPLSSLQGETPQAFSLLGQDIVLFLDAQGRPAALQDRSCHRTAKLSKGRCIGGRLERGCHGWIYDGGGKGVRIPQYHEVRPIPADYCTPSRRCEARNGCAWAAPDLVRMASRACISSSSTASRPSTTATSSGCNGFSATTARPTVPR